MNIVLENHNPNWKVIAQEEIAKLKDACNFILRIEHYGSTAIKDLPAKPIIDLIAEVDCKFEYCTQEFENLGYVLQPNQPRDHLYFLKISQHLFQLRVFSKGAEKFIERINFRDNLNNHEYLRQEYLELKEKLAKEHPNDLRAYTDAKGEFVKRYSKHLITS